LCLSSVKINSNVLRSFKIAIKASVVCGNFKKMSVKLCRSEDYFVTVFVTKTR
jgi:hypothetical protein